MNYDNKRLIEKISYTALIIIVNLILICVPVFGINSEFLKSIMEQYSSLSFANSLTGNALGSLSMGAFSISSIVTVNIFLSIAIYVSKPLENLQKDGEYGRLYFQRLNTVLSVIFTLVTTTTFLMADKGELFIYKESYLKIIPIIQWSFATFIISVLSNGMRDHGIGEGISILLFTNIALGLSKDINILRGLDTKEFMLISLIVLIVIMISLYLNSGIIKIPLIQNSKTMSRLNKTGYLPINTSIVSVMPIIYTVMITNLPSMFKNITGMNNKYINTIVDIFTPTNRYKMDKWYYVLGFVGYIILVYIFSKLAAKMNFSPADVNNQLREKGDIIPNVKPGEETKRYLEKNVEKICQLSFLMLMLVAIIPDFVIYRINSDIKISLLGTSLVIIVTVFYDLQMRFKAYTRHLSKSHRLY